MLMDVLITYSPDPVKPALYVLRRFPSAFSLGLVVLGTLAFAHSGRVSHVTNAAWSATNKSAVLGDGDVEFAGLVVTAVGALYPAYRVSWLGNRTYVFLVYGRTCRAIQVALATAVRRSGGLLYAVVRYRGVVIDAFGV